MTPRAAPARLPPRQLLGNPAPFAFKYTVGNVLSLCSYAFLVGPARQCTGMFAPERALFTVCYLGSFATTLFCVFYLKNWLCTLLALVVQFAAMVLYALSYLPAGMGLGLVRRLLGLGLLPPVAVANEAASSLPARSSSPSSPSLTLAFSSPGAPPSSPSWCSL